MPPRGERRRLQQPVAPGAPAPPDAGSTPVKVDDKKATPSPSSFPTITTASPTRFPTVTPTIATGAPTTAAPTVAPSPVIVGKIDLLFSLGMEEAIPLDVQEWTLVDILNVALCSSGLVELVTLSMDNSCSHFNDTRHLLTWKDSSSRLLLEQEQDGQALVLWDEPAPEATWALVPLAHDQEDENHMAYWKWNFTYFVFEYGNVHQKVLQDYLDDSITSGRMNKALLSYWPNHSPRASLLGQEATMLVPALSTTSPSGVPLQTAAILRWIGVALAVWIILSVIVLTALARKRRERQLESKQLRQNQQQTEQQPLSISFMIPPTLGFPEPANKNTPNHPKQSSPSIAEAKNYLPSLLKNASSLDDDEEDVESKPWDCKSFANISSAAASEEREDEVSQ